MLNLLLDDSDSTAPLPWGILFGYRKAKGVNPDNKSGAGVPKAARSCTQLVPATPATVLGPSVLAPAFPLDYPGDVERGDLLHG